MRVSHHAQIRLLERVFGIDDTDDKRSLKMAENILLDNSVHLEDCNCVVPLVGFKGVSLQIRSNVVVTVLIKGFKR